MPNLDGVRRRNSFSAGDGLPSSSDAPLRPSSRHSAPGGLERRPMSAERLPAASGSMPSWQVVAAATALPESSAGSQRSDNRSQPSSGRSEGVDAKDHAQVTGSARAGLLEVPSETRRRSQSPRRVAPPVGRSEASSGGSQGASDQSMTLSGPVPSVGVTDTESWVGVEPIPIQTSVPDASVRPGRLPRTGTELSRANLPQRVEPLSLREYVSGLQAPGLAQATPTPDAGDRSGFFLDVPRPRFARTASRSRSRPSRGTRQTEASHVGESFIGTEAFFEVPADFGPSTVASRRQVVERLSGSILGSQVDDAASRDTTYTELLAAAHAYIDNLLRGTRRLARCAFGAGLAKGAGCNYVHTGYGRGGILLGAGKVTMEALLNAVLSGGLVVPGVGPPHLSLEGFGRPWTEKRMGAASGPIDFGKAFPDPETPGIDAATATAMRAVIRRAQLKVIGMAPDQTAGKAFTLLGLSLASYIRALLTSNFHATAAGILVGAFGGTALAVAYAFTQRVRLPDGKKVPLFAAMADEQQTLAAANRGLRAAVAKVAQRRPVMTADGVPAKRPDGSPVHEPFDMRNAMALAEAFFYRGVNSGLATVVAQFAYDELSSSPRFAALNTFVYLYIFLTLNAIAAKMTKEEYGVVTAWRQARDLANIDKSTEPTVQAVGADALMDAAVSLVNLAGAAVGAGEIEDRAAWPPVRGTWDGLVRGLAVTDAVAAACLAMGLGAVQSVGLLALRGTAAAGRQVDDKVDHARQALVERLAAPV